MTAPKIAEAALPIRFAVSAAKRSIIIGSLLETCPECAGNVHDSSPIVSSIILDQRGQIFLSR